MTEGTITQDLLGYLKKYLPGAVVLKHCDRFTTGIPDLSVSFKGNTFWFECKYEDMGKATDMYVYRVLENKVQNETMRRLYRETNKAWFLIWVKMRQQLELVVMSAEIGAQLAQDPNNFIIMMDRGPSNFGRGFDRVVSLIAHEGGPSCIQLGKRSKSSTS
jgi:hypothetical protein